MFALSPHSSEPEMRVGASGGSVSAARLAGHEELGFIDDAKVSLFGSPAWIRALSSTYGLAIEAMVVSSADGVEAAVLFSEINDIRGKRISSLPFSDYLDPMVGDLASWKRLVDPLIARGVPLRFRCVHNNVPLADNRFHRSVTAHWHAADLRRSEAETDASLRDSALRNVRKATRSGVVVREGRSLDDLRTFYRMHCHIRKSKYQLFAQPFSFFENLHAEFSEGGRLIVLLAEVDGVAIGGIVFLVQGDTLYYKFNASLETALRPNDLLVWTGLGLGRAMGLASLDFGISDLDQPGLVRFKQKFATEERPVTNLVWRPETVDARGQEVAETLGRLTRILTAPEVPDEVTRAAGDELYHLFC